jgi:tRNA(Ser,Leu) C12 N-acetylase TAN1
MGMMDNTSSKAKDMMSDPDKKKQIEQMAKEQGITMEQAKEQFAKSHKNA